MKKNIELKEIIDTIDDSELSENILEDITLKKHDNFNYDFDIEIEGGKIYNQKNSGMCWIYSGFNMIENDFCFNMDINIKEFSFSTSFLAFFDYLEKSNAAYQIVIDNNFKKASEICENLVIQNCLKAYGNFSQFRYLVNKYGLVPKEVMPDAILNLNPGDFRWLYNNKVLNDCLTLYNCKQNNKINNLYLLKKKMLRENYKILCKALGKPPIKFKYDYTNLQNNNKVLNLTPLEFKKNFLSLNLDDYILLDSLPKQNRETHEKYCFNDLKNVYVGISIDFISVTKKEIKEFIIKQLEAGVPVYCSCDSRRMRDFTRNIIDLNIYDLKKLGIKLLSNNFAADFNMIGYYHVVCIKGTKMLDDDIIRWKIEDSYGNDNNDGYIYMSDDAFDYFVFSALINKKYISNEIIKKNKQVSKPELVY